MATYSIKQLRQLLEQQKGRKFQLESQAEQLKLSILSNRRKLRQHEQARELIRQAGLLTQQQLQYHISDVTSLALNAVFDEPYLLNAEFVERRNKIECDLSFMRDDLKVDPLTASGGGAVDVASFALRVASWSMRHPKTRNVIILDEPLKFLSEHYQAAGSEMLKEISRKLGIQFIIVTHMPVLAMAADKTFEVSMRKGVSKVTGSYK